MIKNLYKILSSTFIIFASFYLEGCIEERYLGGITDPDSEHAIVSLHLRALDATRANDNDVEEKISSLRVIMIDEEGTIECNELIEEKDFHNNPSDIEDLYYFLRITSPGIKNFYLFANEDHFISVNKNDDTIEIEETSLGSLLKEYRPGESHGKDLEDLLETIFFTPDYEISGKEITLPYSCHYKLDMQAGVRYDRPMWLVPVATKFYFNFTNNRSHDVEITKLGIPNSVSRNYVLGNVGKSQQQMIIGDLELYWVDWLAEIVRLSNIQSSFESNVNLNEKYGWISDYKIPTFNNSFKETEFEIGEEKIVPGRTENGGGYLPTPGRKSFGPFYLPETRFPLNGDEQVYHLNLQLNDTDPSTTLTQLDPIMLTNVKSLFRNTKVVINITMNEGTDDIYVEIRSWNSSDIYFGTANKQ